MSWDPHAALADVVNDPSASNSDAYQELLGRCPVDHLDVHGSKVEWWGVFAHAEVVSAGKDF